MSGERRAERAREGERGEKGWKDEKKWIYKRYEGKFAYFPIISTWHLVHGLYSSTQPGKKIASRPRERNIVLMSLGMPRYPSPRCPPRLLSAAPSTPVSSRLSASFLPWFSAASLSFLVHRRRDIQFVRYLLFQRATLVLLLASNPSEEEGRSAGGSRIEGRR